MITANDLKNIDGVLVRIEVVSDGFFFENKRMIDELRRKIAKELENIEIKVSRK